MKCGNEFIIKEGRTEQKKRRKLKKLPDGITITTADELKKNTNSSHAQHAKIIKQMKHVKSLNQLSRQCKQRNQK